MSSYTTYIFFLLLTLTSCKNRLSEPISFFGNYELQDGNYKLVGIGLQGEHIEGYKNFYIDDIETLQKMREQWVFEYSTEPMACGFGYELRFLRDTLVLSQGLLNLECGYLNTKRQKWLHFPSKYLTDHVSKIKELSEIQNEGNHTLKTN